MKKFGITIFLILDLFILSHMNQIFFKSEDLNENSYLDYKMQNLYVLKGANKLLNLEEAVKFTQKAWLRPKGLDYFHLNQTEFFNLKFLEIFEHLNVLNDIYPKKQVEYVYNTCFVHGMNFFDFQIRFKFMIHLWKLGYRWKRTVFLTGERDLDPIIEHPDKFHISILDQKEDWVEKLKKSRYENEMIRVIFQTSLLPEDFTKEVHFAEAKKIGASRPNTLATLIKWIKDSKDLGIQYKEDEKNLAISNQPFVMYQDLVAKSVFGHPLETVGPKVYNPNFNIIFDVLARTIFEIQKKKKLEKGD